MDCQHTPRPDKPLPGTSRRDRAGALSAVLAVALSAAPAHAGALAAKGDGALAQARPGTGQAAVIATLDGP